MIKEIAELNNSLEANKKRFLEIQSLCPHNDGVGVFRGNTGNYCPEDDSYWIEFRCSDCGLLILIDSEEDAQMYNEFSRSGKIRSTS